MKPIRSLYHPKDLQIHLKASLIGHGHLRGVIFPGQPRASTIGLHGTTMYSRFLRAHLHEGHSTTISRSTSLGGEVKHTALLAYWEKLASSKIGLVASFAMEGIQLHSATGLW